MSASISSTSVALSNIPQIKQSVTSALNQITLSKQSVTSALSGIAQISQELAVQGNNSGSGTNDQSALILNAGDQRIGTRINVTA